MKRAAGKSWWSIALRFAASLIIAAFAYAPLSTSVSVVTMRTDIGFKLASMAAAIIYGPLFLLAALARLIDGNPSVGGGFILNNPLPAFLTTFVVVFVLLSLAARLRARNRTPAAAARISREAWTPVPPEHLIRADSRDEVESA